MSKRTVRDIMTVDPACCRASTPIRDVAQLMVVNDCGEIPVLDEQDCPVGVVTDRDVCCRVVAAGLNPDAVTAMHCMSRPCVTIRDDASLDECCQLVKHHQIRRVPVVDAKGRCRGIVAQADLARALDEENAGSVVRAVSKPTSNSPIVGDGMAAR
jgi:CBS domain-containing protein